MVAPRRRSLLTVNSNDAVARDARDREPAASGQVVKNAGGIPTQDYADRVKLAQHLHDQGINPLIWTQAQPASFAEQEQFRKTGQKPRVNQFEVGGRLYDATPALAATPAQARVALDTYRRGIGDRHAAETPPIDQYVEIDKVPLQHPYGAPITLSGDKSVDVEVLRNFIRIGVDPKSAHLGDPLPAKLQAQIKEMLNGLPANAHTPAPDAEAADPSSLLYRGADGWIYAKNEATREPEDVQRIRASHAEKRAAGAAAPANDDDVVEEIARYYGADPDVPIRDKAYSERPTENADLEQIYNEQAAERLAKAAADMPYLVSAIEKSKAGQALSSEEQQVLANLESKFAEIGLDLDPAVVNLEQLKSVASIIANTHATLDAKSAKGETVTADTRVGRAPLHIATQSLNNELAQAIIGSTVAWAQVAQNGPAQALMSALMSSKRYGRYADLAKLLGTGSSTSISAAQIAKEWAEQEGSPDIFSPYTESSAASNQSMPSMRRPLPALKSGLTVADIDAVEKIFNETESSFSRAQPLPVPPAQALEMLRDGTIEGVEIFGFPMVDPRGNWQTKGRAQKLKLMSLEKLKKCGAELLDEWGGDDPNTPGERQKERHVPPGVKGTKGARKADLSFKIRWRDKIYILDINTVDVLKSGLMTAREALALKSLMANRLARLKLKESRADLSGLEEYEGRVGAFKKGKDMSDEDWEKEAQDWVDDFIDCDGPLEVKMYDDDENFKE